VPSWADVVAMGTGLPGVEESTPHYDGHGSVLVDLAAVDPEQLRELVEEAWRRKATAALRARLDAG
jgi:hypothetical protein